MKKYEFSLEEKDEIRAAVKSLEEKTGGEVVPYFVRSSHDYAETPWMSATFGGAVASILVYLAHTNVIPVSLDAFQATFMVVFMLVLGFFLPVVLPQIKRMSVSDEKLNGMVLGRAKDAFFDERVSNTKDRTGILIFVSRFEREVVVLGDEGINAKVSSDDWKKVVSLVIEGIQKDQIGAGMVKAIQHCEKLLLDKGFKGLGKSDPNEISDDLRIKDK